MKQFRRTFFYQCGIAGLLRGGCSTPGSYVVAVEHAACAERAARTEYLVYAYCTATPCALSHLAYFVSRAGRLLYRCFVLKARQASGIQMPPETAGFGCKESTTCRRFQLDNVISTVPHSPLSGEQRHPYFHRPSRVDWSWTARTQCFGRGNTAVCAETLQALLGPKHACNPIGMRSRTRIPNFRYGMSRLLKPTSHFPEIVFLRRYSRDHEVRVAGSPLSSDATSFTDRNVRGRVLS